MPGAAPLAVAGERDDPLYRQRDGQMTAGGEKPPGSGHRPPATDAGTLRPRAYGAGEENRRSRDSRSSILVLVEAVGGVGVQ